MSAGNARRYISIIENIPAENRALMHGFGMTKLSLLSTYEIVKMHNKRQISVKLPYFPLPERKTNRLDYRKMACLSGF